MVAALAMLVLPGAAHADESLMDAIGVTNGQAVKLAPATTVTAGHQADSGAGCIGLQSGASVTANGNSTGLGFCLFEASPIEQISREFHRARIAARMQRHREREEKRRAERRAVEARQAKYVSANEAKVPSAAPVAVKEVIEAANSIATTPYSWGGGHVGFESGGEEENGGPGYDCSGAVSFALHGAGLLDVPMTSGALESYGAPGPGRWITIYANAEHTYAVIAGLRWDTVGDGPGTGPRWHEKPPYPAGFVVRHPVGY